MGWMLDTNVCICLLNQRTGYRNVLARLDGLDRAEVLISSITTAELRFGVSASARPVENLVKLERFLAEFEIAGFDDAASRRYGPVRAALKTAGTPIGPLDLLIAGHALALDATVVTNNLREFSRVPGLRSEDWLVSG